MSLPTPTKRPTPAEYQVLFVASSFFFFALGVFALILGLTASPEDRDVAHNALVCGAGCVGVAVIIGLGFFIARRCHDHGGK